MVRGNIEEGSIRTVLVREAIRGSWQLDGEGGVRNTLFRDLKMIYE